MLRPPPRQPPRFKTARAPAATPADDDALLAEALRRSLEEYEDKS